MLNVAVTDVAAETVTEQVPVPVQAPDHPAKVEPALGVAVSVTVVPLANPAEQVEPQLIPAGELVTEPVPVPEPVMLFMNSEPALTTVPPA